eukprot:jgi/Mesen1/4360/ME000022S03644
MCSARHPSLLGNMGESIKLLYIVVQDDEPRMEGKVYTNVNPRYTRSMLTSTLQIMGCKTRHAHKICHRAFELFSLELSGRGSRQDRPAEESQQEKLTLQLSKGADALLGGLVEHPEAYALETGGGTVVILSQKDKNQGQKDGKLAGQEPNGGHNGLMIPSSLSKVFEEREAQVKAQAPIEQQSSNTAQVKRKKFLDVVCRALAEYRYIGPNQRSDLMLACRLREKKMSVTVLLCGTSGCGKSTLSSLLASRLGISTVVSTDSVRHMMRSFTGEDENPLLWSSTYHAGEFLDPVAVAQAKAKTKASTAPGQLARTASDGPTDAGALRAAEKGKHKVDETSTPTPTTSTSATHLTIPSAPGMQQAEAFASSLPQGQDSGESSSHKGTPGASSSAEGKAQGGQEMVAGVISAKEMAIQGFKAQSEMVIDSLDRLISQWEQRRESVIVEGVHLSLNFVVNNTNVDKSVAAIHATTFACLRRQAGGEALYDPGTNTVRGVLEEYQKQYATSGLTSKGMFKLIQRQGSSRSLMALVHSGSGGQADKEWPVSEDNTGGFALAAAPSRGKAEGKGMAAGAGQLSSLLRSNGEPPEANGGKGPLATSLSGESSSNDGGAAVAAASERGESSAAAGIRGSCDTSSSRGTSRVTSPNMGGTASLAGVGSPVHVRFGGHGLASWASANGRSGSTHGNDAESRGGGGVGLPSGPDHAAGSRTADKPSGTFDSAATPDFRRSDSVSTEKEHTTEAAAVAASDSEEDVSEDTEGGSSSGESSHHAASYIDDDEDGSVDEEDSFGSHSSEEETDDLAPAESREEDNFWFDGADDTSHRFGIPRADPDSEVLAPSKQPFRAESLKRSSSSSLQDLPEGRKLEERTLSEHVLNGDDAKCRHQQGRSARRTKSEKWHCSDPGTVSPPSSVSAEAVRSRSAQARSLPKRRRSRRWRGRAKSSGDQSSACEHDELDSAGSTFTGVLENGSQDSAIAGASPAVHHNGTLEPELPQPTVSSLRISF